MKFLIYGTVAICLLAGSTIAKAANLVCYYDSSSLLREGLAKFTNYDLELSLQFCTHLIYGYVGIKPDTYQAYSLNEDLDIGKRQYYEVTAIKRKFPQLKILLSVGGDKDTLPEGHNKYIEMLEGGRVKQTAFINSAYQLVRSYGFDGLDLSFQFPKTKPRKVHSKIGSIWKSFKKFFTGDAVVDEKAAAHKEQFTAFVRDVKQAFRPFNLTLSLTVLPNVNSSWYFDVPAIRNNLDIVTLAAFDFMTPTRNPNEADFPAPLYEPYGQNRDATQNVDSQVNYWLAQKFPAKQLVVGLPAFARAWKTSFNSGAIGTPVVSDTDGPAPAGLHTQTPGLLSWPEICAKLSNTCFQGGDNLCRISDLTKRVGNYAFRPAGKNINPGIWIGYEDPYTAANKAVYVRSKNLGGLAIFDLSYDDFHGICTGDKFPILRAAKYWM